MRPTAVVLSLDWVSEQGHGSNTSRQSVFCSSDQQSTGAGDAHRPTAMCEVTPRIQNLQGLTSQQAQEGAPACPRGLGFLKFLQLHRSCCEDLGLPTSQEKCKLLHLIGELVFCELVEEEKWLLDGNST